MLVTPLSAQHQFELMDAPRPPEPGPGEIQVAVKAIGICGSDLHNFSEGGIGGSPCVYPMVLGHEPAGVVVKTGPGVTGWSAGDAAVLEPAMYCYHCEYCMSGHHNVCANLRFLSMPGEPGFFREYVNLPLHNLIPLPRNLSLAEGTVVEPLAVIVHSLQFIALRFGETAVVFGAGPIGLLTIAALKLTGASRVWAVDPVAHRREMAKVMGADVAIDPAQSDPVREILTDTGQRGVDVAIDCASKDDSIDQCIQATRSAGRVVMTGIPSSDYIRLPYHILRRREIAFYTVRRSNRDSETALHMLAEQPRRFVPMLTHSRPLSEIQSAFELVERYSDGVGKFVLTL